MTKSEKKKEESLYRNQNFHSAQVSAEIEEELRKNKEEMTAAEKELAEKIAAVTIAEKACRKLIRPLTYQAAHILDSI